MPVLQGLVAHPQQWSGLADDRFQLADIILLCNFNARLEIPSTPILEGRLYFFAKNYAKVLTPLPRSRRGQVDADDVQAVEQVFAKAAPFYHLLQFLVGGRHDLHIQRYVGLALDPADLLFLDRPQ